jgi:drug/metabolite transporter (DMT)-like permease
LSRSTDEPDESRRVGRVRRSLPYAVAILVTILWSSSFVLIKWGLSEIPPLFFATLRYSLAFVVLLVVEAMTHSQGESTFVHGKRETTLLVIAGVGGYTIAQGFQFLGLYYLPAVTTSFLLNFNPFFVLILAVGLLDERVSILQLGGLGLALIGAFAFFSERVSWEGQWFGVLIVIISGLGWAVYIAVIRLLQKSGRIGSLRLTTETMGVGVVGMAVLTVLSGRYSTLSTNGVLIIVWLATVNTALAFFMWNWTLKAIPAYELTVLQDLMLVEIAFFALAFLGETITPIMAGGIVLVLVGVMIAQLRGKGTRELPEGRQS